MVYIILGKGFEPVEAIAPCDILRRGGVDVKLAGIGGKTVEEAKKLLDEDFAARYDNAVINVKLEDVYSRSVSSNELSLSLPSEETAQAAYSYGREGGFF